MSENTKDKRQGPYLSIVIPAYNEEKRLPPSLQRILEYLVTQDYTAGIIVVDDGSADHTPEFAREILQGRIDYQVLTNSPNLGKALSVKRGLTAARGRFVLFSDADLSTPIEESEKLLGALEAGADVAIASRQLPESRLAVRQPLHRELAGRLFGLFNRLVLLPGIPDSQCGFKAFRAEVIEPILSWQKLTGWAFDAELLFIARRLGYTIEQLPVTWINDDASKVNMLRDGLRMVYDLLSIRFLHRSLAPGHGDRDTG